MTLNVQSVAGAMGAPYDGSPVTVNGWSVDTRTQNVGDMYFALSGPTHDGHDFIPAAIEKGASAVVVSRPGEWAGAPVLLVDDTLSALQRAASWARQEWGGTLIGVTGSAGKTTTKDAIAHVLASSMPTGKTVGNFNNHIGVPLSILRLPNDAKAAVLEVGMNHAGEIRHLSSIARPQFGVVTNVGYAHVEFFPDGIEGVAAAKRELIEELPRDGVAVLNADDPRVARFGERHHGRTVTYGFSESADVRAESADLRAGGSTIRVEGVDYETSIAGHHNALNLLAAIAVGREFGVSVERMQEAIGTFHAGKMRGERIDHNGIAIWNDCYNSNPEAVEAMLDLLQGSEAQRRIAVLGEMLELGDCADQLHRRVGQYAAEHGVDLLIGVRGCARAMVEAAAKPGIEAVFFDDAAEAGDFARSIARAGDAVLFKGSRGVRVERALERFLA